MGRENEPTKREKMEMRHRQISAQARAKHATRTFWDKVTFWLWVITMFSIGGFGAYVIVWAARMIILGR